MSTDLDRFADILRHSLLLSDRTGRVDHIDVSRDSRSDRCRNLRVIHHDGSAITLRVVERAGVGGFTVTVAAELAPAAELRRSAP